MRILVVDDDESLVNILKKSLAQQNYAIDTVNDGEQGWIYGSTYTYDLIILDWSLPKLDGISLCQRFRKNGYHMPILLLTARSGSQAKITGLDAGADDYLGKPFDIDELAARIRALLRRVNSNSRPVLSWGDLQLDPCSGEVTYRGQLLLLTAKEYGLLELFLRHNQKIFSIEEIIQSLWSSLEYPAHATVRSHLRRLRNQLKLAGLPEDLIETVRGRGYCLKPLTRDRNSQSQTTLLLESDNKDKSQDNKQSQHLAALNSVWEKYRHRSKQQLVTLESAVKALKKGYLSQSDREEARLIAHTLVGNLGIFGFDTGSELAKELELLLETDISQETDKLSDFESIFNALRQELFTEDNPFNRISSKIREHSPLLLIVDSDTNFTEELTQQATDKGIRTAIAPNPQSARAWLDGKQSQDFPNVVLIKLSFASLVFNPPLRLKYLSLIAEFKLLTPSIPVLVIADSDRVEDRLDVARHGGSFYLKQPITPTQVITFCKQVIEHSSRGKKIMIVDDDVDLLRVLPSLLKPWQFQLTTLDNPRQFWEVLQAIDPHLLVLDIEMPHISGIELCQVIRNHSYWRRLPVLFLSVHTDLAIREQALTNGADDFITKPVIAKQLAVRILNCLERRA